MLWLLRESGATSSGDSAAEIELAYLFMLLPYFPFTQPTQGVRCYCIIQLPLDTFYHGPRILTGLFLLPFLS